MIITGHFTGRIRDGSLSASHEGLGSDFSLGHDHHAHSAILSAVYLNDRERWGTTPKYSMATESPGDPVSSDTTPLRPDSPCHGTSRAAEGKARWPVDHHQK